ncbi:hypothetical protein KH5H1_71960 [Corallococcus caeni]|uniref:hypothetical protein n=1 Tax=Corallococcus caeni TaxID=3082388 RepID=UPI0029565071|nr:hypothetical protein KH5H1_71960 [Corallococcus sp. KH5-1]
MKPLRTAFAACLVITWLGACSSEDPSTPDAGQGGPYDGCRQEGEELNAKVIGATCCEGLTRIEDTQYRDGGVCEPVPPDLKVCTRCGNGQCGPGESPCNCPQDCP